MAWVAGDVTERGITPGKMLEMSAGQLTEWAGLDRGLAERVARLLARGGPLAVEVDRLSSRGIRIIAEGDEEYPNRLAETLGALAPPLLFGAGNGALLSANTLAIVGSRDADDKAISFTEKVGSAAGRGGLTIGSGAARGVDSAAMNVALEHGGSVVGIVADALSKRIANRPYAAGLRMSNCAW